MLRPGHAPAGDPAGILFIRARGRLCASQGRATRSGGGGVRRLREPSATTNEAAPWASLGREWALRPGRWARARLTGDMGFAHTQYRYTLAH
ncbi:hypothetical protein [Ottowia caeni]|uniref:hypothetical protein n=1 Tax=Ottowia caeni TaxID=2870339 RepID=UPI001E532118|nr:hypothetical protein [Ottowia caeni]